MSSGGPGRGWLIGAVVLAGAVAAGWMALRGSAADPPPAEAKGAPSAGGVEASDAAATERRLAVRKGGGAAKVNDPVLQALAPQLQHLRCPSGELEPGPYETRPAEDHFAEVSSSGLSIAVPEGAGSVWLERGFQGVAHVEWADGACSVTPVTRVAVRGLLEHADGSPAADHEVVGCLHGERAITDAEGRWELMAAVGTNCHPMAFAERDDGRLGKSTMTRVRVEGPGPLDGGTLVLPAEDALWSPAEQEKMAGQLAMMMEKMTSRRRHRLPELQAAAEGLSGEERARADALVALEADFLDMVDGEIERLDDPDERVDALRDAFLSLN